jgi:hypothetical protein
MNKNIISSDDLNLLFGKLISDNILVTSSFTSLTGFRLQFTGVLDKKTSVELGILIRKLPLATESDSLMVPFLDRNVEFSYCDPREIPLGQEETANKVGDTVLMMRFLDSDRPSDAYETLILFFKL